MHRRPIRGVGLPRPLEEEGPVEHVANALQILIDIGDTGTSHPSPNLRAIRAAIARLRKALGQLRARGNPTLAIVNPRGPKGGAFKTGRLRDFHLLPIRRMGTAVYQVKYRHADDGKDYIHDFENPDDVALEILDDHTVCMVSSKHPLIGME